MSNRATGDNLEDEAIHILERSGIKFRKTGNSGAKGGDGDARGDHEFMLECKHKESKGFSIPYGEFTKAKSQANNHGLRPLFIRRQKDGDIVVAMDIEDFVILLGSHQRCKAIAALEELKQAIKDS